MKPDAVSVFPRPNILIARQPEKLLQHLIFFFAIFGLAAESGKPVQG